MYKVVHMTAYNTQLKSSSQHVKYLKRCCR